MKIKEDWWKQGITVSNDKVRPGTYRTSNTYYGSYAGVRINRAIAEELVGYNTEANESEEKGDVSQYDKIKWIVQTVDFLTSAMGSADIQLIRQILKYSDVDELLSILSRNGKILKMDQTSFKSVF